MRFLLCSLTALSLAVHALLGCCWHHEHMDFGHGAACARHGSHQHGSHRPDFGEHEGVGNGHDGADLSRGGEGHWPSSHDGHADCSIGCQGVCAFLPSQRVAALILPILSQGAVVATPAADPLAPQVAGLARCFDGVAAKTAVELHRLLQVWRV
jgi:hypothetical protein